MILSGQYFAVKLFGGDTDKSTDVCWHRIPTLGSNASDPYGSLWKHVPGTACCFLNTEKTLSTHVFSALYYIYLSFNVSFLLLHSFGKAGLSAALTKQLLTEWSCWTGILIQTAFFICTGCWDGAPVGTRCPPVPQTCWSGMGIVVKILLVPQVWLKREFCQDQIYL